ncbi:MAG: DUF5050 domain-containing protein [Bacteroidota bacterium]
MKIYLTLGIPILLAIIFITNFKGGKKEKQLYSILEIYDITTNKREIILEEKNHFEAPNWSMDGKFLIINSSGKLYKIDLDKKTKTLINTGFATNCNNDHGITPDNKSIIISHHDETVVLNDDESWKNSRIYKLPIKGGIPQIITDKTPSFWHGISPDGQTLVYTAERNKVFNIYEININGGNERQLTNTNVLDDGPDFSPDGKYIYYNTFDSGSMEIWRMTKEGKLHEQLTKDEFSNWFPHPNPNGNNFVFISYDEDQGQSHPAMKKVTLKLFDLKNNSIKTLCKFTGGQGSINVPSWSPDGRRFAFVSYELK